MKFQYQFCWNGQKCKNSKNDFPREVEKFPSRGSKKNYVRENLQHLLLCVMIFLLSNDFGVSFEVIAQVVVFGHSYKKEKTYDIAAVRFRFSCLCKEGD